MSDALPGMTPELTPEPLTWSALQLHARHVQHLQRGLDTFSQRWLDAPTPDTAQVPPLLRHWVASRLHRPVGDAAQALPAGALAVWQGWVHYDAGQMAAAQPLFLHAWQTLAQEAGTPWRTERADAALGLGKTHTRSGHWACARDWLLCSLAIARRAGDDVLCCKGYGALGELLLRAGHAAAGFACLNMAYQLLPAGSGQRARQLNYLGSALRRLDEPLRAESVLMTSLYMARDLGDTTSQWHALARLQFLALASLQDSGVAAALQPYIPTDPSVAPAVARGFWRLGCARAAFKSGAPTAQALDLFRQAAQAFDAGLLPMEHGWAALWQRHLTGDDAAWLSARQAVLTLMQLPAMPAPPPEGVIDESFASLPIGQDNGFSALLAPPAGLQRLEALDRLFFI